MEVQTIKKPSLPVSFDPSVVGSLSQVEGEPARLIGWMIAFDMLKRGRRAINGLVQNHRAFFRHMEVHNA